MTSGIEIRSAILAALNGAKHALSTTELRVHLNSTRCASTHLVSEQVYRSLIILAHQDRVSRLPAIGNRAYWTLAVSETNLRSPRRVDTGFGNSRAKDSGHGPTI